MGLNLAKEGLPFGAVLSVVEERFGAVFEAEVFAVGVADAFPVAVADDAGEGDVVLFHEVSDQAGGAGFGGGEGAVAVFAHFDADGVFVTRSFVVGVLTLFISGEGLVGAGVVDGEVPGEVAEGVVF